MLARGTSEDARGGFDRAIATCASPRIEGVGRAGWWLDRPTLSFGMGDKLTKGAGNKTIAAETTIVLYGQGAVEFKYVNPQ